MDAVNKTLYIPLYGKAYVSKKGIILSDPKAEEIWASEGFKLKRKSKSKWLAYYMGMRSAVFDHWLKAQIANSEEGVVLHIGCGMDSRIERVGSAGHAWYDVDFPEVIRERKRYFCESNEYNMIEADVRKGDWIAALPKGKHAIVVMEGVSMYLHPNALADLLNGIQNRFEKVNILMDCYTSFAAKASKFKNPINEVGASTVYGLDNPKQLEERTGLSFLQEHEMTPRALVQELKGMERCIFKAIYAGSISKKLYRLYEFKNS